MLVLSLFFNKQTKLKTKYKQKNINLKSPKISVFKKGNKNEYNKEPTKKIKQFSFNLVAQNISYIIIQQMIEIAKFKIRVL